MTESYNLAKSESDALSDFDKVMTRGRSSSPGSEPDGFYQPSRPRIKMDPENTKHGLAKLALTIIELLRELLERQALRRVEGGSLTAEETERLGTTFMRLAEEMEKLKKDFGLEGEDLNIDLGPLGKVF